MRSAPLAALCFFALIPPITAACGSDEPGKAPAAPAPSDTGSTKKPGPGPSSSTDDDGGPPPATTECPRLPKGDDYIRKVVISHPYGENGAKATAFEVLELGTNGELTRTNTTFQMGRSLSEIAFTPDGEVGLVAQENGSVGVFKFDAAGNVSVVHTGFQGGFDAARVVVSHDGSRAFILDRNTKENDGGVYQVRIGCDGKLSDSRLVVPGGKAHAMALIPTDPERAVLIAGAAFDSPPTDYAHRLDVAPSAPTRIMGGSVFATEAIASWVAVTPDGKWALVTDDSLYGSKMAPIDLATMKAGATISVSSPAAVVMSPFGNAALLLESSGTDHLRLVTYDSTNTTTPFAVGAEVAYKGGSTELPGLATAVERGTLKGRVLVAELQAVRMLSFESNGSITDVKLLSFKSQGFLGMVGALGVQP